MISMILNISLPSGYEKNTLVLMVQSPRVLYVYWELSAGQRMALAEKGTLQLRLNVVNAGPYRVHDIMPHWDSFYFTGVEPGREYYCDISVMDGSCECYPLIYSNHVFAPAEGPAARDENARSSDFWGTGELNAVKNNWDGISSGAFYKD